MRLFGNPTAWYLFLATGPNRGPGVHPPLALYSVAAIATGRAVLAISFSPLGRGIFVGRACSGGPAVRRHTAGHSAVFCAGRCRAGSEDVLIDTVVTERTLPFRGFRPNTVDVAVHRR